MQRRRPHDTRTVSDLDMTAHDDVVDDDDAIPNVAIMSHMGICHNETMGTDTRERCSLRRSPVNGHVLTEHRMSPDDAACRLAAIFEVLRGKTNGHKREYFDVSTDFRQPIDDDTGMETHPLTQRHIWADGTPGTDRDILAQDRLWGDQGTRMNVDSLGPV